MTEPILIEVCVDSVASAVAAERGGASRVELCSNLLEGGITPSAGLIAEVREKISIGMQVMIRPRAGDFVYSQDDLAIMRRDIQVAKDLRAEGVVLGILSPDGSVNVQATRALVELARPLHVTFHRAFDMAADLLPALEAVCAAGADRLLTSGGEATCLQGVEMIARLNRAASGRIVIMAGGSIGVKDASKIIQRAGVKEVHVGLSTPVPSPMLHRNPRVAMGKAAGREYQRTQVLEEDVRKLRSVISVAKT